jgi:hypothetical protein
MPPKPTPNSLILEAKPPWEVAVRLIERLTDADERRGLWLVTQTVV